MLREQLAKGSTGRIRWLAAQALDKRNDPDTVRALGAALSNEKEAWMTRAEAAQALGKIRGPDSYAYLEKRLGTAHPKVRRAIVTALGSFRTDEAAGLLSRAARTDKSYLVGADAARALGETRQESGLRTLVGVLREASWADVKRAGALDGLAALGSDAGVKHVIERTRYGHTSNARRAAVVALAKLSDERKTREHIEQLLDDADPHFRMAVVGAIQTLGDPRARGGLRRRLEREIDGRVARRLREALRALGQGPNAEHRRMSDEIEQLRRDLEENKETAHYHGSKATEKRSTREPGSSRFLEERSRGPMSDDGPVQLQMQGHVALVTRDRPAHSNAMNRKMVLELGRIGRELSSNTGIRAVILTGSGERAFCAGADLKERRAMSGAEVTEQLRLYRSELAWIDPCPAPVVAAINGVALGGGLELALRCDLRVAVDHAVLGLPKRRSRSFPARAAPGCCRAWSVRLEPRADPARAPSRQQMRWRSGS